MDNRQRLVTEHCCRHPPKSTGCFDVSHHEIEIMMTLRLSVALMRHWSVRMGKVGRPGLARETGLPKSGILANTRPSPKHGIDQNAN
jgi:hypothetical protein